jgi:sterol 3beta-glucosyltransferase
MHYALIAIGSRGDTQPFIALALGLRLRGHHVTLLAHENFKPFVESYHIDFHPLTGNTEDMLAAPEHLHLLQSGNTFRLLRYIHERARQTQDRVNQDLLKGCQAADVLVTSALGAPWISCIAEKTGKRWALIQLSFPVNPTSDFPFAGFDFLDFPSYNRWTYELFRSTVWRHGKKDVNHFRESLGLPALTQSIFDKMDSGRILTLYAVSPALLKRPPDWDANIKVTGFLTLPPQPSQSESIPSALREWLLAGDRPIYIGFGSMPIPDPGLFGQVLDTLLTRTNHRFLFCGIYGSLPHAAIHHRLAVVPAVDHAELFPHCKAAIIHGGVGTLAAALTAGVPPIIVSIFGDQHWWGKYIEKKQLGRHIPFKKLTPKRVITALDSLGSASITGHVATLARQLQREDGLNAAITNLEEYFCS